MESKERESGTRPAWASQGCDHSREDRGGKPRAWLGFHVVEELSGITSSLYP